MHIALHQPSSSASGLGGHRLPTGSGRVTVQLLPPASSPAALLLVESRQQTLTALKRTSTCTDQFVLTTRPGICTKLCVRQPLRAAGPSLWKAQLCSEYTSIT